MIVTLNLAGLIGALVSVVLPLLVGLVTKSVTSSSVKAILLLLFAALTALFTQYLNDVAAHHAFNWPTAGLSALLGYALALGAHFGLLKPIGATAAAQRSFNK